MIYVIKKDGTREEFNSQKIVAAVNKSAARILYTFSDKEKEFICQFAEEHAEALGKNEIEIQEMHNIVEGALERVNPAVAKSYRDYRNYKLDFIHMMDDVYTKSQAIRYIGDKSNANTDSALVATKRSLIFNELNKELYRKFFMNRNELQACKDGYIYIHDQSARLDTMNCCLFDVASVLSGGFEMGNVWYNEPKTLDTAFDVMGDIILSTAAQQYGEYAGCGGQWFDDLAGWRHGDLRVRLAYPSDHWHTEIPQRHRYRGGLWGADCSRTGWHGGICRLDFRLRQCRHHQSWRRYYDSLRA